MKRVFIIASSFMALSAQGQTTGPADSLKISKDMLLDEVVVTATKVTQRTPVAYCELTKDELNRRNDGQGIPFLKHRSRNSQDDLIPKLHIQRLITVKINSKNHTFTVFRYNCYRYNITNFPFRQDGKGCQCL